MSFLFQKIFSGKKNALKKKMFYRTLENNFLWLKVNVNSNEHITFQSEDTIIRHGNLFREVKKKFNISFPASIILEFFSKCFFTKNE